MEWKKSGRRSREKRSALEYIGFWLSRTAVHLSGESKLVRADERA